MKKWTGNIMTLDHFFDFYYLEALRAGLSMAKSANPDNLFRKAFLKLENDVNETFDALCDTMALHIYVYLWVAALGEATYADENCETCISELTGGWSERDALNYFPSDTNVQIVKDIYDQSWASGGYGGDAWLEIVEAMDMYGKVTNATFIDHAVDLEHNGGNVFDKTSGSTCGLECYGEKGDLKEFLNVKFTNDILNNIEYKTWTTRNLDVHISKKVHTLMQRYHNIVANVGVLDIVQPTLEFLTPYSVDWDYQEFNVQDANGGMECEWCHDKIDEDDHYNAPNGDAICEDCYENHISSCEHCGEATDNDEMSEVTVIENHQENWCEGCVSNDATTCDICADLVSQDNALMTEDNYWICEDCKDDYFCEECNEYYYDLNTHNQEEHPVYEPAELPVDADGFFEIVNNWEFPHTFQAERETGGIWREKIFDVKYSDGIHTVQMHVMDYPQTGLFVFCVGLANRQTKHSKLPLSEFGIMTPCGLWFSGKDKTMRGCLNTVQRVKDLIDWTKIKTVDDWNLLGSDKVHEIQKVVYQEVK